MRDVDIAAEILAHIKAEDEREVIEAVKRGELLLDGTEPMADGETRRGWVAGREVIVYSGSAIPPGRPRIDGGVNYHILSSADWPDD
jgi:hypothetical protein